jgi:hypothetical protein
VQFSAPRERVVLRSRTQMGQMDNSYISPLRHLVSLLANFVAELSPARNTQIIFAWLVSNPEGFSLLGQNNVRSISLTHIFG